MYKLDKRVIRWLALALGVVTFLLFFPARNFGFIDYDDGKYVFENEHVQQGLTAQTVKWAFLDNHFFMWHPLTSLSHLLDITLFGMNPHPEHLVNVILHSLSSVLLFLFLLRATNAPIRSLFVAMLFAWHPLRVESVAWISERKDVLCTLFWLLTLHAYLRYTVLKTKAAYWLTVGTYALGIMTKPMAATLPFALLLLDVWPLNRLTFPNFNGESPKESFRNYWMELKPKLLEKVPFFALSALLCVLTYTAQKGGDVLSMMESTTFSARAGNALISYLRYISKVFWPVDLAVLYPHPGTWPAPLVMGAAVLLLIITWIFWQQRVKRPWLLVSWFWFLGILVPASGIIQAGGAAMADRYSYISTIGLLIIAVWSVAELQRIPNWGRNLVSALGCGAVASCLVLTHKQLLFWRDTETLFTHAVNVTKKNAIAEFILGYDYLKKDRTDDAIKLFLEGLKLNPNDAKAWYQLGRAQEKKQDFKKAADSYHIAIEKNPELTEAQFQLALLLVNEGKLPEAEAELQQFLRQSPKSETAWNNLGNVQFLRREFSAANESYLQAAQIAPDHADTWLNLANLHLEQKNVSQGLAYFAKALELKKDDFDLWSKYAFISDQYGASSNAIAALKHCLTLNPAATTIRMQLAWRLSVDANAKLRNGKEAIDLLTPLTKNTILPSPAAAEIMAAAQAESGQYAAAIHWAEKAKAQYEQANNPDGAARVTLHLARYRQNKPWRDIPKS